MPIDSTFELYRDTAGEWRWRLVVPNGNIIADSGEGYKSKQGAKRGIRSVKNNASNARVVVID
ncbi:HVO_2922 family protein [Haladaptatus halobius]|uniref:HVO_2922 family protein n=1 Tax=Haladaptatus halobius TaxID=2884875 RepID=UPI001D0AF962|nr:HVO_2922 family protein [Haladaptatus halobius]